MAEIFVYSKETHQVIQNVKGNGVGISENSVIVLNIKKDDVLKIERIGNNVVIHLNNGELITIEDYFKFNDCSLVLHDDQHNILLVNFTDSSGTIIDPIIYEPIENIEPLLYDDDFAGLILPWAAGGVAAGGLAALGGSSGSSDSQSENKDENSIANNFPSRLSAKLNYDSGTSDSDSISNKGQMDISGLDADAIWEYSIDGGKTWIKGIGSSFNLAEGHYSAGEILIKQTNTSTNVSVITTLTEIIIDKTIDPLTARLIQDTGPSNNDNISQDGTINVSGIEAGATWSYSTDNGQTWATGTGNSFTLAEGKYTAGQLQIKQVDVAGNESPVTKLPDITISSSEIIAVDDAHNTQPFYEIEQEYFNYSGTDTQSLIVSKDQSGNDLAKIDFNQSELVGSAPDGATELNYSELTVKANTLLHLSYYLTEPAGEVYLTVEKFENGAWVVVSTGKKYTKADFPLSDQPAKIAVYNGENDAGQFRLVLNVDDQKAPGISIDPPITGDGDDDWWNMASASITPMIARMMTPAAAQAEEDTTLPDAPSNISFNADGTVLEGNAEPGSLIEVREYPQGRVEKTITDPNGNFSIALYRAFTNGEEFEITATDPAGNTSQKSVIIAPTGPSISSEIDQELGAIVSGITEPNANIEVRDKDYNLIDSGKADENGLFTIHLSQPQDKGQELQVTATNMSGLSSSPALIQGPTINSVIFNDQNNASSALFTNYEINVKATDLNSTGTGIQGNILLNDVNLGHNIILTHVGNTPISGSTVIPSQQNAGTLIINEKGEYIYTGIDRQDLGKTETFSYTIADANDPTRTAQAELKIMISAEGVIIGTADSGDVTLAIGADRAYASSSTDQYVSGDDIYVSRGANETIKSGSGNDTLILNLLNQTDGTGGNGQDVWENFTLYDAASSNTDIDFIDVRGLLEKVNANEKELHIKDYLSTKKEGNDTVLYVDLDGSGSGHESTKLLTLKNVDTTIDDLISNHLILF